LLTGFLGSGKTTLLSRVLALPDLRDTAVIISEFGAVALDHLLLEARSDDVVELPNGCTCCAVRQGWPTPSTGCCVAAGRRPAAVPAHRARDQRARRSRAHALHALGRRLSRSLAAARPRRDDGRCRRSARATLDRYPEAVAQAAVADLLAVTKTDIAPSATALQRLASLNPTGADRRCRVPTRATCCSAARPRRCRGRAYATAVHAHGIYALSVRLRGR
jgi:hypothetical protein